MTKLVFNNFKCEINEAAMNGIRYIKEFFHSRIYGEEQISIHNCRVMAARVALSGSRIYKNRKLLYIVTARWQHEHHFQASRRQKWRVEGINSQSGINSEILNSILEARPSLER